MIEILKDCPYCGGKASIRETSGKLGSPHIFWVGCDTCFATTDAVHTRSEAVEKWNRRAEDEIQISEMEKARFDSALELIRGTCRSYRNCAHCPLFTTRRNGLNYCRLETVNPADWLLFSEEEAHKEREVIQ